MVNLLFRLLPVCSLVCALMISSAQAANIVLNVVDDANEGFNDTSAPFAGQTGNTGTTLGEQRLQVFQAAADYWEERLVLTVDVVVDISFDPLFCASNSATLGSAGARNLFLNFTNAPRANTLYVSAVANNLAGRRLGSNSADIAARFNSDIDNNSNCLGSTNWWLGINSPAPRFTISLFDTVLHEIGHGLGVASGVRQNGELLGGFIDAYALHLYDQDQDRFWGDMTTAQRVTSSTNTGKVSFRGPSVEANTGHVQVGKTNLGHLRVYAPNPFEPGSSISHWDTVLTPDELMEPSATPTSDDRATLQMLKDVGWGLAQDLVVPGELEFNVLNISANETQGTVPIQIQRRNGSNGAVSVTVSSANGSAIEGQDYVALNQTVSWADGETGIRSVNLSLINDNDVEPDETVQISLNNATGGAVASNSIATVTIESEDVPPAGSIGFTATSFTVNETQGTATVSVTRTGGSGGAVSASFSTANDTAIAGQDYVAVVAQTVSWADGETGAKSVSIGIINDTLVEANETVALQLSNVSGGASLADSAATLTIVSDDVAVPGTISFVNSAVSVNEGVGEAEFVLQRTGGSDGAVSVRVRSRGNTALAGQDYVGFNRIFQWADGDTSERSVLISIIDDDDIEGDENTNLIVDNPTGGVNISNSPGVLTIQDNDGDVSPNPPGDEDEVDILELIVPILGAISGRNQN